MKRFLIKISYTVLPLWILTVGLVVFYYTAIVPNMQGDLGVLGKIPSKFFYESPKDSSMISYWVDNIEIKDANIVCSVDIATCGDSFSQQGLYGYQNYMVRNGFRMGNFPSSDNPFQTAASLLVNNDIDTSKVRILIIETVERSLVDRLLELDLSKKEYALHKKNDGAIISENRLIETKNYIFFKFGWEQENPVKEFSLKESMFSGSHGNELYVYYEDLENAMNIPQGQESAFREKVNSLFEKAKEKGIHLIILVCPDKYDMYQEYILEKKLPHKTINEDFRKIVGSNENIIIAKEILMPYIKNGIKDMYHLDDTHWSYKSARIVADTLSSLCKNIR